MYKITILGLVAVCSIFNITAQEKWEVLEVKKGRLRGVFRYIKDKPKNWDSAPLSTEVSLIWKFQGDMPDKQTKKLMDKLELALEVLLEKGNTHLPLVMTMKGHREWCYYTKSYPDFMKDLNKAVKGHSNYPIKIVQSHDPKWEYWHSFVDKIKR